MSRHKTFEIKHAASVYATIHPSGIDPERMDVTVYENGVQVEAHMDQTGGQLLRLRSDYVDFLPIDPPTP